MASFRKRGAKWEYRIRYKDPLTGISKEKSKGGFRTKPEAKLAAEQEERKLADGIDLNKQDTLLKDYLNLWYEKFKEGTVSWGTAKTIHQAINICNEHLGNLKIKNIDKAVYQEFINKIAPMYSKSTLQRHNSRLSEAFEQAIELDYIRKNPARKVKYPVTAKGLKNPKKHIELEDYLELMKAMEKEWSKEYSHYKYITFTLVGTGARIGEICALSLKDINFKKKTVRIDKTFIKEGNKHIIKPTTKTGKSGERTIGIDDFTLKKLKEWLAIRNEIALKQKLTNDELFFLNQYGDFIKTSNYGSALEKTCQRNNLRHMTPHMFRHTHETIMWESGVTDINFIGARLGDKDKSILVNTYGHKSAMSEQQNMNKINEFMSRWANSGQELLKDINNS